MSSTSAAVPDVRQQAAKAPVSIPISGKEDGVRRPAIEVLGGEAPALASVIRSKIEPPQLRSSTLSRRRLLDSLTAAVTRRVTLLVAEAGYGKTTLLTDFSSRSITRCLWYKLDATDQDSITLVNYLIASAREVAPDFGQHTLSLLTTEPTALAPRDAVVSSLMAELHDLAGVQTTLILDDFHAVDQSHEASDLITRLIRDAPSSFSFILSSRRRPSLLLARLAARGELSEIGMDELRFSRDETGDFFAENYGKPLDPDVLTELDARTHGWAATLQLFCSSIRGKSVSAVRSLVRSMSGSDRPIYDFLAEEVLGQLPSHLQEFVTRSALLEQVVPEYVTALFGSDRPRLVSAAESAAGALTRRKAKAWIEQADRLGILARTSQTSNARQFHPLLREFLLRQLSQRTSTRQIRAMHRRVAKVAALTDPLVASHHFIEAGDKAEAMRCLAASVLLTMGSGRWGTASELIARLKGVPADPAVAVIKARRHLDEGDFASATAILNGIEIAAEPPTVRAIFRHTRLSLGWRQADTAAILSTLSEIQQDSGTPPHLREIAQFFLDASPESATPVPLPTLALRLQKMAERQAESGHTYYAAISLHNAAYAELNAGRYREAIDVGVKALAAFDVLSFAAPERHSTLSVIATAELELGMRRDAEDDMNTALSTGMEPGDVPATLARAMAIIGEREASARLLLAAEALERQGLSDLHGKAMATHTRSYLQLATNPLGALAALVGVAAERPLDLGTGLERHVIAAIAHLLRGDSRAAATACQDGLLEARRWGGMRAEVRLEIVLALARQDAGSLRPGLARAASFGELAILEIADALGEHLDLLPDVPSEVGNSIAGWKTRWLPVLRRQLERGATPAAHVAARLLDEHGALEDVPRLRAFEKTYLRRGRAIGLGRALARRVSDPLHIRDLGRVRLQVGERIVPLSGVRRKPAALLMYLVTRPNYTATREQVLDDLWPDVDPVAALNSLNQSLYFLRREIDPWYEDDVSADYVAYQGELVWLDAELVVVSSSSFLDAARALLSNSISLAESLDLLASYGGSFCPEFEYEDWAMSWRTRIHAAYLNLVHNALAALIEQSDLRRARDLAMQVLVTDPTADDIELVLIWLFWRLGAASAAQAQYQHLAARAASDGLEAPTLEELTSAPAPPLR